MAQEFEDAFEPAHELAEEAVVVDVDFVDELVEVVFVAGAEINKGLDRLVRVGGDVLALGALDGDEHVVGEGGEVGDAVVDVGGFVDAHEGFVEDGEEVAEELEGYRLERVSDWVWSECGAGDGAALTSSIMLSIIALSRCRVYSFRSCFR